MSFYNLLFGVNPQSDLLLGIVALRRSDVGRFRDCYADRDGEGWRICVYTRNGGGNREHYDDDIEPGPKCSCTGCVMHRLPQRPGYLFDEDDNFDCTYAMVYFRPPREFWPLLDFFEASVSPEAKPAERWIRLIEKLRAGANDDPEVRNAMSVCEPIFAQINDALSKAPQ